MSLRLLEMVLPEHQIKSVQELLQDRPVVDVWYGRLPDSQTLVKILVSTEETESLIDRYFSRESGL
jgi:cell fate (sporulation/competence/biofilm development) regulator YmcA (YheA/YmcA/DUF963 family)